MLAIAGDIPEEERAPLTDEIKRLLLQLAKAGGVSMGDIALLRKKLQEIKRVTGLREEIVRAPVDIYNLGDHLERTSTLEEVFYLLTRLRQ